MWLVLALIGCGDEGTEPVVVPSVQEPAAAGDLRIATAPAGAEVQRAPVLEAPLPAGAPVVRDCFGGSRREARTGGPPPPRMRPSAPAGGAAPGSGAAPAAPAESAPPASVPSAGDGFQEGGGLGGLVGGEGRRGGVVGNRKDNGRDDGWGGERELKPAEEKKAEAADQSRPRGEAAAELAAGLEDADAQAERHKRQSGPVYDWGATVYLSNDDSMSLASAQRVLYATSRGMSLSPAEIRPHELLNYFSFDSVAPAADRTFGVLGSAERAGDTLTVALAVRGANPPRQPLDLTILVDRSGSMSAEGRMAYTQRGLNLLGDNLQRGDRLDLVLFDGGVCTPLEGYVVGRDDPALLRDVVAQMRPTGSTNLDAGLQEAFRIQTSRDAADTHRRNRRVLLITDAELNTGNVSEDLVSEVGRQLDENGIHLSGIGVGRDFNDRMLDLLTEKGRGAYVYLGSEAVVDRIFGPGFDSLVRTVARDVQFSLVLPDSLAMARFYGEESSTDPEDVQPIHYYAGTTQLFLQDLAIRDGKLDEAAPIVMRIAFRDAITLEPVTEELRTTVGALLDGDAHNLRKGRALMAFSDWVLAGAMHADPCGEPLTAYRGRSESVPDDAEIAFVNGMVGARCGVALQQVATAPTGVTLKVKLDADIPIGRVELACGGRSHVDAVSAADTVAKFTAVQPGACTLHLEGNTPMVAAVEVPGTGGDLRCVVRGGRVSCS